MKAGRRHGGQLLYSKGAREILPVEVHGMKQVRVALERIFLPTECRIRTWPFLREHLNLRKYKY